MVIPIAMVKLDETHTALGETAGEETVGRERSIAGLSAIHLQHRGGLFAHVYQIWHAGLHLERHLILRNAR